MADIESEQKMSELEVLEKRSDKLADDLVRLQDLREKGVDVKWYYKLTLEAYLDTQKEIKKLRK